MFCFLYIVGEYMLTKIRELSDIKLNPEEYQISISIVIPIGRNNKEIFWIPL